MFAALTAWPAGLLAPQGPVAAAERAILVNATVIMLAVVGPVIVLTLAFAWWFRAGNARATRRPDWAYSGPLEVTVWSIPLLVVLFLGGIAWIGSHDLDPGRPLGGGTPFEVQVVALDWKWLFIYPSEGVASIDRLVVPAGVPLRLTLTSATVMNSFLVPQLGSQIYAMAGMATTLNLKADKPGRFPGLSAQFSGPGFSDMRFVVDALPRDRFDAWLAATRHGPAALAAGGGAASGPTPLDTAGLRALMRPGGAASAATTYGAVAPGLFDVVMQLAAPGHDGAASDPPRASASAAAPGGAPEPAPAPAPAPAR